MYEPFDQPTVLADPDSLHELARVTTGEENPSNEEKDAIIDEVGLQFMKHVESGKTREAAAKLIDDQVAEILAAELGSERYAQMRKEATARVVEKVKNEIQEQQRLLQVLMRQQEQGGPEVTSRGIDVNNQDNRMN